MNIKTLPENEYPPRWCKYCRHFGEYDRWNACYRGNFIYLLMRGPRIVNFDACCDYFEYAKQYRNAPQKTR